VGLSGGLDVVVKKHSQPLPGLEPPIIQPIARSCSTVGSFIPNTYTDLEIVTFRKSSSFM